MAISYTVTNTFSPNTTIQSAQVNTNFSDNANTWTGLEALTKTFSKLKVDVDPATALEVATKQYVDQYAIYRRPNLQYSSATVVNLETGLNGTSGQALIQFPDGSKRTDSTATRINLDVSRVAAISGTAQSGLRTGTVAVNTWYAVYLVKVTDASTTFVAVADTVLPIQANYATLNTNFGTNGWVYIGMIRNGDNSGATNVILNFVQVGNVTTFKNTLTTNTAFNSRGIRLASTASASSLTYSFSSGTGATQIPNHCGNLNHIFICINGAAAYLKIQDSANAFSYAGVSSNAGAPTIIQFWDNVSADIKTADSVAANLAMDINLAGWVDGVLGIGSNPLL